MDEESTEAILIGLGIICACLGNLVGLALGIAGLCTADRRNLFPLLGVTLNAVLLIGVCGLIAIGLALG